MPRARRCSTIAWLVARMWSSLKLPRSDEPRWPEVPKATRCAGSEGSGFDRVVRGDEARDVDEEGAGGGLAGELVQGHRGPPGCRRPLCPAPRIPGARLSLAGWSGPGWSSSSGACARPRRRARRSRSSPTSCGRPAGRETELARPLPHRDAAAGPDRGRLEDARARDAVGAGGRGAADARARGRGPVGRRGGDGPGLGRAPAAVAARAARVHRRGGPAPARRAPARRGAPGGARRPRDRGDRAGRGPRPRGRAAGRDVRAGPRASWPARRSRRGRPASAASRCACSRRWRRCWRARPATRRRRSSASARRPSSTSSTARGCRSTARATRCASSPGSCRT